MSRAHRQAIRQHNLARQWCKTAERILHAELHQRDPDTFPQDRWFSLTLRDWRYSVRILNAKPLR